MVLNLCTNCLCSHLTNSGAVVGTCSAVAELFPGDQIRVTGDDEFPGTARGDGFSGFTGYMISRLD